MYQRFPDPWHQSEFRNNIFSYSRNAAILHMKNFGINRVVEFGCGLGYYTKMLSDAGFDVLGVDMSQTAIEKAPKNFPKLKFKVDQIENIQSYSDYDCFLLAEIV